MSKDVRDIVGSTHVAGRYNFTDKDFLNEGADAILELGSRVIKLWFTQNPKSDYPFNSNWPEIRHLTDLANTPYFRTVFEKTFTTYILEAFAPGARKDQLETGLTREDIELETSEFYSITKYLLNEYRGTGKTFILQNWETDWLLTNPEFTKEPHPVTIQAIIEWINARQEGVNRAREEVGMDGVTVAHAMEVNLVARAMDGFVSATNDIVPHTHCDIYSYSAYDTVIFAPERFKSALDYLAKMTPPSTLYGDKNVMIGEFGAPENEYDQYAITKKTVEEALDWGAHYIVYWELYCNEPAHSYEGRPTNSDHRGFWLIRPDGTKAPAWNYFCELFNKA